jgi:aspartate aminotransferase-like enzyme
MGEQCRPQNVRRTLEAIGRSYHAQGINLRVDDALAEFDALSGAPSLRMCV